MQYTKWIPVLCIFAVGCIGMEAASEGSDSDAPAVVPTQQSLNFVVIPGCTSLIVDGVEQGCGSHPRTSVSTHQQHTLEVTFFGGRTFRATFDVSVLETSNIVVMERLPKHGGPGLYESIDRTFHKIASMSEVLPSYDASSAPPKEQARRSPKTKGPHVH